MIEPASDPTHWPKSIRISTLPRKRRIAHAACRALFIGLPLLALGGCETIMVESGARMRLDGVPLQSITATLQGKTGLSPGASAPLSIVALAKDGRTLATVGTGDGNVLADSYRFEASVVTVSADGVVSLPADPRLSFGSTPHIRITAAGQSTPVADLDIPVRYDVHFDAIYAGRSGMDGMSGSDGRDGSDGSMGSSDPDNPSAGGNGGDGGNGENGHDGDAGGPGPDVHVWIALDTSPHPLLRVRANANGQDQFFLVDPVGGSLTVDARGGRGGSGGRGGNGGQGGAGGSGSPSGSPGSSGTSGLSGQDGSAGVAGHVVVSVDNAAAPYLDRFQFTNEDGARRPGPKPVIEVGSVPLPW